MGLIPCGSGPLYFSPYFSPCQFGFLALPSSLHASFSFLLIFVPLLHHLYSPSIFSALILTPLSFPCPAVNVSLEGSRLWFSLPPFRVHPGPHPIPDSLKPCRSLCKTLPDHFKQSCLKGEQGSGIEVTEGIALLCPTIFCPVCCTKNGNEAVEVPTAPFFLPFLSIHHYWMDHGSWQQQQQLYPDSNSTWGLAVLDFSCGKK